MGHLERWAVKVESMFICLTITFLTVANVCSRSMKEIEVRLDRLISEIRDIR